MQVNDPPTQQYYCATLIIPGFLLIYKVNLSNGFVCCIGLCREFTYLHGSFVRPQKKPTGGREVPPPTGRSAGETRHTNQFL